MSSEPKWCPMAEAWGENSSRSMPVSAILLNCERMDCSSSSSLTLSLAGDGRPWLMIWRARKD